MEIQYKQVLQIGAQLLLDPPFENSLFKPPSKHVGGQREHRLQSEVLNTGLNLAFSEYLVLFIES